MKVIEVTYLIRKCVLIGCEDKKMKKVEILQKVTITRRLTELQEENPWMVPEKNTENYAGEKNYHLQPTR